MSLSRQIVMREARGLDAAVGLVALVHERLEDPGRLAPGSGAGRDAREPLADLLRREPRLVEADEDLERLLGRAELVLVEVDGGDAAHQALLLRRLVDGREPREERRGLGERAAGDADLAGERERADVVRLEHRDVLERGERAVGVALLAEHAGPLPEELADLGLVLADLEALAR